MGKTKTAFVGTESEVSKKSSEAAYKEKKEKQAQKAASVQSSGEPKKVHISGLKGGQRIKIVEAQEPTTETGGGADSQEKEAKKTKAPKVRSKKYQASKTKIDQNKTYSVPEAIKLVKETSYSAFDGAVELHLVLKKKGISTSLTLPFSTGRQKRVEVADEKTIEKLEKGKIDFDVLLATADLMPKLVPFAKLLGPKGLMPNPKNGTIIKSAKDAAKFSGNTLNLRTEKEAPLVHTVVGRVSQKDEELAKNMEAVLGAFGASKQIVKTYTKATMGPSVKVQVS